MIGRFGVGREPVRDRLRRAALLRLEHPLEHVGALLIHKLAVPFELAHILNERLDVSRDDLVQIVEALARLLLRLVPAEEEARTQLRRRGLVLLSNVDVQQRPSRAQLDRRGQVRRPLGRRAEVHLAHGCDLQKLGYLVVRALLEEGMGDAPAHVLGRARPLLPLLLLGGMTLLLGESLVEGGAQVLAAARAVDLKGVAMHGEDLDGDDLPLLDGELWPGVCVRRDARELVRDLVLVDHQAQATLQLAMELATRVLLLELAARLVARHGRACEELRPKGFVSLAREELEELLRIDWATALNGAAHVAEGVRKLTSDVGECLDAGTCALGLLQMLRKLVQLERIQAKRLLARLLVNTVRLAPHRTVDRLIHRLWVLLGLLVLVVDAVKADALRVLVLLWVDAAAFEPGRTPPLDLARRVEDQEAGGVVPDHGAKELLVEELLPTLDGQGVGRA